MSSFLMITFIVTWLFFLWWHRLSLHFTSSLSYVISFTYPLVLLTNKRFFMISFYLSFLNRYTLFVLNYILFSAFTRLIGGIINPSHSVTLFWHPRNSLFFLHALVKIYFLNTSFLISTLCFEEIIHAFIRILHTIFS